MVDTATGKNMLKEKFVVILTNLVNNSVFNKINKITLDYSLYNRKNYKEEETVTMTQGDYNMYVVIMTVSDMNIVVLNTYKQLLKKSNKNLWLKNPKDFLLNNIATMILVDYNMYVVTMTNSDMNIAINKICKWSRNRKSYLNLKMIRKNYNKTATTILED